MQYRGLLVPVVDNSCAAVVKAVPGVPGAKNFRHAEARFGKAHSVDTRLAKLNTPAATHIQLSSACTGVLPGTDLSVFTGDLAIAAV